MAHNISKGFKQTEAATKSDIWIVENLYCSVTPRRKIRSQKHGVAYLFNLPQGLPMRDCDVVEGRVNLGGDFERYSDSWRIICVRTLKSYKVKLIVLIDGTGATSTNIKRNSYESGFRWDVWMDINLGKKNGKIDGYYFIAHEKRRGGYLGETWTDALIELNSWFA